MGNSVSNWVNVSSSVPQGSVLGPILFVIFINDLPDCVSSACICKMYADDTKLLATINSDDDHAQLQVDLNSINDWTHKWLMELNIKKCKVMHTGYKPTHSSYSMEDVQSGQSTRVLLETTKTERDLGFQMSADLKCHDQAQVAAAKANRYLGILKNTFVSRDANLWKKLYTTYVRPQLEYAVPVWSPYMHKDIDCLEKIQHRATKIPHSLKSLQQIFTTM